MAAQTFLFVTINNAWCWSAYNPYDSPLLVFQVALALKTPRGQPIGGLSLRRKMTGCLDKLTLAARFIHTEVYTDLLSQMTRA